LLLPAWPGSYIGPPLEAKLHHFSLGLMHLYITLPAFGPPKGDLRWGKPLASRLPAASYIAQQNINKISKNL